MEKGGSLKKLAYESPEILMSTEKQKRKTQKKTSYGRVNDKLKFVLLKLIIACHQLNSFSSLNSNVSSPYF